MEILRRNENQENQRFFDDKENVISHNKKNVLSKNQRTIFEILHSNFDGKSQSEQSKNQSDTLIKTSYVVPSQIHSAIISGNIKEPAFKIYEDMVQDESNNEVEQVTITGNYKEYIPSKEIYSIPEENSIEIEDNDFPSENHQLSCSLSLMELKLSKLTKISDEVEYINDNYNFLKIAELKYRPRPDYMKKQPHIDEKMRAVVVNWLVSVTDAYQMQTETLYLAVSYIDRFLSKMSVVVSKLQLIGTTALMIATKVEEVLLPCLEEYVKITDDSYPQSMVIKMEGLILKSLTFELTVPTSLAFLNIFCFHADLSDMVKFLAMYMCELTLLETIPYLQFLPSCLAAAAVALAQHTLQKQVWPHELELFSGYALADLQDCLVLLNETYSNAEKSKLQEIRKK